MRIGISWHPFWAYTRFRFSVIDFHFPMDFVFTSSNVPLLITRHFLTNTPYAAMHCKAVNSIPLNSKIQTASNIRNSQFRVKLSVCSVCSGLPFFWISLEILETAIWSAAPWIANDQWHSISPRRCSFDQTRRTFLRPSLLDVTGASLSRQTQACFHSYSTIRSKFGSSIDY